MHKVFTEPFIHSFICTFRLKQDMQDQLEQPLIDKEDKVTYKGTSKNEVKTIPQITFCLSNLMLTGTATPYLHNGVMPANNMENFDVIKIILIKLYKV